MPLYELHNIRQQYNGRTVLSIDHWSMEESSITGLSGPNGSGKTTLLNLLSFVISPSSGKILFDGKNTDTFSGNIRNEVTLLPQDTYLLKRDVAANIAYGLKIRRKSYKESAQIQEALALVGLAPHFARRPWFALSGGEARRVALAARLVLRPRVLLLDEPNSSVDAFSAQLIKQAAIHAHQQWGTSLIVISHDIPWLRDISHNMVHMYQGRIVGSTLATMLYGPWQQEGQALVSMQLTDRHRFVAARKKADHQKKVATIDPDQLSIYRTPDRITAGMARMEGVVINLGLEKISGSIYATVRVGQVDFNSRLSRQNQSADRLSPGDNVWVTYATDAVQWFEGSS